MGGMNQTDKKYSTMVLWWERVAKVQINRLFIREGTERRREETVGNLLS
jgi:hypothetical protein